MFDILKSININFHINKIMEKSYMIISAAQKIIWQNSTFMFDKKYIKLK